MSYIPQGIVLAQKKFTTHKLLKDSNLSSCKSTVTPLPPNCKLSPEDGDLLLDPTYYRTTVGKLNFLTHTRPDLSFTAQTLSQFMQEPCTSYLQALHHTLKYLQGIVG